MINCEAGWARSVFWTSDTAPCVDRISTVTTLWAFVGIILLFTGVVSLYLLLVSFHRNYFNKKEVEARSGVKDTVSGFELLFLSILEALAIGAFSFLEDFDHIYVVGESVLFTCLFAFGRLFFWRRLIVVIMLILQQVQHARAIVEVEFKMSNLKWLQLLSMLQFSFTLAALGVPSYKLSPDGWYARCTALLDGFQLCILAFMFLILAQPLPIDRQRSRPRHSEECSYGSRHTLISMRFRAKLAIGLGFLTVPLAVVPHLTFYWTYYYTVTICLGTLAELYQIAKCTDLATLPSPHQAASRANSATTENLARNQSAEVSINIEEAELCTEPDHNVPVGMFVSEPDRMFDAMDSMEEEPEVKSANHAKLQRYLDKKEQEQERDWKIKVFGLTRVSEASTASVSKQGSSKRSSVKSFISTSKDDLSSHSSHTATIHALPFSSSPSSSSNNTNKQSTSSSHTPSSLLQHITNTAFQASSNNQPETAKRSPRRGSRPSSRNSRKSESPDSRSDSSNGRADRKDSAQAQSISQAQQSLKNYRRGGGEKGGRGSSSSSGREQREMTRRESRLADINHIMKGKREVYKRRLGLINEPAKDPTRPKVLSRGFLTTNYLLRPSWIRHIKVERPSAYLYRLTRQPAADDRAFYPKDEPNSIKSLGSHSTPPPQVSRGDSGFYVERNRQNGLGANAFDKTDDNACDPLESGSSHENGYGGHPSDHAHRGSLRQMGDHGHHRGLVQTGLQTERRAPPRTQASRSSSVGSNSSSSSPSPSQIVRAEEPTRGDAFPVASMEEGLFSGATLAEQPQQSQLELPQESHKSACSTTPMEKTAHEEGLFLTATTLPLPQPQPAQRSQSQESHKQHKSPRNSLPKEDGGLFSTSHAQQSQLAAQQSPWPHNHKAAPSPLSPKEDVMWATTTSEQQPQPHNKASPSPRSSKEGLMWTTTSQQQTQQPRQSPRLSPRLSRRLPQEARKALLGNSQEEGMFTTTHQRSSKEGLMWTTTSQQQTQQPPQSPRLSPRLSQEARKAPLGNSQEEEGMFTTTHQQSQLTPRGPNVDASDGKPTGTVHVHDRPVTLTQAKPLANYDTAEQDGALASQDGAKALDTAFR
eukprot:g42262.t1